MEQASEIIFSVSEFIELLNIGLNKSKVKMVGEVSEAKINSSSGHVYFVLKDKKDGSVMNCVIFKYKYAIYGIKLEVGMEIVVFGCPNVHKTYGFSFIAETIEFTGEGTLKKEYEKLKKKLAEEGIFAIERKREIPKYIRKIGLITSRQGAVLADFLTNLGKYGFKIKMIDSRVEGQGAVEDLLAAIKTFKNKDIEALVIMRGGGSLESMMAFNNELLVREVASFPVPVIAAIGHDKDDPLITLAADLAVSTPSIAATTITEPWRQISLLVETALTVSFQRFNNIIQNAKINLENLWEGSIFGFESLSTKISQQLEHSAKIIELNNPERQLKLGYSIARCGDKIVRSVKDVKPGDNLNIRVVDGNIISEVRLMK